MKERPERKFYSVPEVAAIFGMTRQGIYLLVKKGEIPHRRLGTKVLIPKGFVDKFIAEK